ncbi:MAG: hypothetical protein WBC92_05015 [Terracidiphilus sp.]
MADDTLHPNQNQGRRRSCLPQHLAAQLAIIALLGLAVASCPTLPSFAQAPSALPQTANPANLPDAPLPETPAPTPVSAEQPCQAKYDGTTMAASGAAHAVPASGANSTSANSDTNVAGKKDCVPHLSILNRYKRFVSVPGVQPLTPQEKGRLAIHNLLDPFNLITIAGEAGISVAANSHSGYGPGMPGFGRYVGVSFTQDLTGEFFGTFLIPSLVHQDPRYRRMPNATVPRRVLHTVAQVFWTQHDNGKAMVNYANLAGFAIDDAIGNLYVPGQQTRFSASAERYGIGLATAPISNLVIEFLPDVARHIHVQIVIVQRIINQVARTGSETQ